MAQEKRNDQATAEEAASRQTVKTLEGNKDPRTEHSTDPTPQPPEQTSTMNPSQKRAGEVPVGQPRASGAQDNTAHGGGVKKQHSAPLALGDDFYPYPPSVPMNEVTYLIQLATMRTSVNNVLVARASWVVQGFLMDRIITGETTGGQVEGMSVEGTPTRAQFINSLARLLPPEKQKEVLGHEHAQYQAQGVFGERLLMMALQRLVEQLLAGGAGGTTVDTIIGGVLDMIGRRLGGAPATAP